MKELTVKENILRWMNAYIPTGKTIPVFEDMLEQYATEQREAGAREYRQFILNVLDGIDIAEGECNTKAIRFAIASRIITTL